MVGDGHDGTRGADGVERLGDAGRQGDDPEAFGAGCGRFRPQAGDDQQRGQEDVFHPGCFPPAVSGPRSSFSRTRKSMPL